MKQIDTDQLGDSVQRLLIAQQHSATFVGSALQVEAIRDEINASRNLLTTLFVDDILLYVMGAGPIYDDLYNLFMESNGDM